MWTSKNRGRYDRSKLRYPSDLTDNEWGLVEPLIPPGKTGGGKRTVIMREVVTDVHSLDRLSVARDPERPAAEKLGLWLLRSVDI
jgi:transposase